MPRTELAQEYNDNIIRGKLLQKPEARQNKFNKEQKPKINKSTLMGSHWKMILYFESV